VPDAHCEGRRSEHRGNAMRAHVGDRLVIKGHHVGEADRDAEILEVRGEDGAPPFLVRWDDDGHEGLFFPGSDALVEPIRRRRPETRRVDPGTR
jgi:hypothetical protein